MCVCVSLYHPVSPLGQLTGLQMLDPPGAVWPTQPGERQYPWRYRRSDVQVGAPRQCGD